jgi:hypothetical protein
VTEILERRRREKVAARLPERVEALGQAVELVAGRLPDPVVDEVRGVADRAGGRLRLSPDHTIAALAGSTGSGKSSLFNLIVGLDLATVGVRRPTTSTALACVWGQAGAGGMLDWLGIERRHQVMRASVLEDADVSDLHGLVLIDLPDHDSTAASHRLEVRRLVQLVDLVVWVVDPQKYADSALHDDFLRPMASHADVMVFVLNHADRLNRIDLAACVADLRALLDADGFEGSPLVVTSATSGIGLGRLRALLAERVLTRRSFSARVSADLGDAAQTLAAHIGSGEVSDPSDSDVVALREGLAEAAGVDGVAAAARRSYALRAGASTGWPPIRWISRLRPDPLKRLGLDRTIAKSRPDLVRSSLPAPAPVQRSQVDLAVRGYADAAARDLPRPWAEATRRAAWSRSADLPDAVDRAIARTDLGAGMPKTWWRVLSAVQWMLFGALAVGLGWLALLAVGTYVGLPDVPSPQVGGIALPLLLVGGGALLGIVVALLARPARALGARRIGTRSAARLRTAVGEVADDLVVAPVSAELQRLRDARAAIAAAAKPR